jgi:hypothetical protein
MGGRKSGLLNRKPLRSLLYLDYLLLPTIHTHNQFERFVCNDVNVPGLTTLSLFWQITVAVTSQNFNCLELSNLHARKCPHTCNK